jgi:hypothetical protein
MWADFFFGSLRALITLPKANNPVFIWTDSGKKKCGILIDVDSKTDNNF